MVLFCLKNHHSIFIWYVNIERPLTSGSRLDSVGRECVEPRSLLEQVSSELSLRR